MDGIYEYFMHHYVCFPFSQVFHGHSFHVLANHRINYKTSCHQSDLILCVQCWGDMISKFEVNNTLHLQSFPLYQLWTRQKHMQRDFSVSIRILFSRITWYYSLFVLMQHNHNILLGKCIACWNHHHDADNCFKW